MFLLLPSYIAIIGQSKDSSLQSAHFFGADGGDGYHIIVVMHEINRLQNFVHEVWGFHEVGMIVSTQMMKRSN